MGNQKGGRTAIKKTIMNLTSGEIETWLKAVRSPIRRVQLIRAAMVVATVALAGLCAMMAADWLFAPLPMGVRWGMLGVWLIAVLAAARFGFGPMSKQISLLQVARWLEVRHPEMEERLSTVLEPANAGGGVSADLLASLAVAAEADAGKVDAAVEVKSARTTRRWGRPAMVLTTILLLALAVWPDEVMALIYEITEDFAVAKLAVEVDAGGKPPVMLERIIPPRIVDSKPPKFRGDEAVVIGELRSRFPGANEIRVRIRAEDARPAGMGGPGIGRRSRKAS